MNPFLSTTTTKTANPFLKQEEEKVVNKVNASTFPSMLRQDTTTTPSLTDVVTKVPEQQTAFQKAHEAAKSAVAYTVQEPTVQEPTETPKYSVGEKAGSAVKTAWYDMAGGQATALTGAITKLADAFEGKEGIIEKLTGKNILQEASSKIEGNKQNLQSTIASKTAKATNVMSTLTPVEQIVYGTIGSLPSTAMTVVSPLAGGFGMGTGIAGSSYAQAKEQGASDQRAMTNALLKGSGEFILDVVGGGIINKTFGVIGKEGIKATGKTVAKNLIEGALAEGVGEGLTEAISPLIDLATIPDYDFPTMKQYFANIGIATGSGALAGLLFAGVGSVNTQIREASQKVVENPTQENIDNAVKVMKEDTVFSEAVDKAMENQDVAKLTNNIANQQVVEQPVSEQQTQNPFLQSIKEQAQAITPEAQETVQNGQIQSERVGLEQPATQEQAQSVVEQQKTEDDLYDELLSEAGKAKNSNLVQKYVKEYNTIEELQQGIQNIKDAVALETRANQLQREIKDTQRGERMPTFEMNPVTNRMEATQEWTGKKRVTSETILELIDEYDRKDPLKYAEIETAINNILKGKSTKIADFVKSKLQEQVSTGYQTEEERYYRQSEAQQQAEAPILSTVEQVDTGYVDESYYGKPTEAKPTEITTLNETKGLPQIQKSKAVADILSTKTLLHGSNNDFSEFDINKFGETDDGDYGVGVYLTEQPVTASMYGDNIYDVTVNIRNPFVIDESTTPQEIQQITGGEIPTDVNYNLDKIRTMINQNSNQFTDRLKKMGYDSVAVIKRDTTFNDTLAELNVFDANNVNVKQKHSLTLEQALEKGDDVFRKPVEVQPTEIANEIDALEESLTEANAEEVITKLKEVKGRIPVNLTMFGQRIDSLLAKARQLFETPTTGITPPSRAALRADVPTEVRTLLDEMNTTYEQTSNGQRAERAKNLVDNYMEESIKVIKEGDLNQSVIPFVLKELQEPMINQGRAKEYAQLYSDVSKMGSAGGQFIQALSVLDKKQIMKDTKDVNLISDFIQDEINKINKKGKEQSKKWTDIQITEDIQALIDSINDQMTDQEYEDVMTNIYQKMSDQIDVTLREQVDALRRIAMLFNPKTHVRNLVGNTIMGGVSLVADKQAALLEKTLPQEERTKSLLPPTVQQKEAATNYFNEHKKDITSTSRWEILGVKLDNVQKNYWNNDTAVGSMLNSLNAKSFGLLEGEDLIFFKHHYINSLAGFMKARGLDTVTKEASDYAKLKAEEATFRQANKIASLINQAKSVPGIGIGIEAAMPFTKTPANIMKTGIDYSPIGLIKSFAEFKSQNKTTAEAIESLSQGLTGTGITMLGILLASMGLARGKYDRDKEGIYEQAGVLPNSIVTPNGSMAVDWAQPVSIPFFMGVAFYEELARENSSTIDATINALFEGGETLIDQSLLRGVKDLFEGYGTTTEKLAGLPLNYVSQAYPTLISQFARIYDPTKRERDYSNLLTQFATGSLQAKTPVATTGLPAKRDIFGEEMTYADSTLSNVAQQLLLPGYISERSDDPVFAELYDIFKATDDNNSVIPYRRVSSFNYDKKSYTLNSQQISDFQELYGKQVKQDLNDLFNKFSYKSASEADKADMINKTVRNYGDAYINAKEVMAQRIDSGYYKED